MVKLTLAADREAEACWRNQCAQQPAYSEFTAVPSRSQTSAAQWSWAWRHGTSSDLNVPISLSREVRMERMMRSKEYSETARSLVRAAQTMTDPRIASQLRTLAEDYERRAKRASQTDAPNALSRSAARIQGGR